MNKELTLENIIGILKNKKKFILLWMLFLFTVVFVFTFYVATPMYQSTSRIIVNQAQSATENLTNSDIQTNLNLITTYKNIIKEPIILQEAIDITNSDYTVKELGENLSFNIEDNSLVFGITIIDPNPIHAAELVNATATTFQNEIVEILPVDSVTILSNGIPSENPVTPNKVLNLSASIISGFFIGIIHALIVELRDNRVKDNQIIAEVGWINLGSISEMSEEELQHSGFQKLVSDKLTNTVYPSVRERV